MAKRKVYENAQGSHFVKVFYCSEWQEFTIRIYIAGVLYSPADAFESDKQSAIDTANAMLAFECAKC